MKIRFRFSIRVLLVFLLVSSLPCWWIASEIAQHRLEKIAVDHMQIVNPSSSVIWSNQTPKWLARLGFAPVWMDRVTRVDATGVTCGNLKWEDFPQSQIDFSDADLEKITDDLLDLKHLNEIYFQVTKISDKSIDVLARLSKVKMLCLHETNITDSGAQMLQARLVFTEVDHHQAKSR